jgi:hypothetical protein
MECDDKCGCRQESSSSINEDRISLAEKMARQIMEELNGRKGYDAIWDDLDEEIRDDIIDSIGNIVDVGLSIYGGKLSDVDAVPMDVLGIRT